MGHSGSTPELTIFNTSHSPDQISNTKFPYFIQPDCTVYATGSMKKPMTNSSKAEFFIECKTCINQDPFIVYNKLPTSTEAKDSKTLSDLISKRPGGGGPLLSPTLANLQHMSSCKWVHNTELMSFSYSFSSAMPDSFIGTTVVLSSLLLYIIIVTLIFSTSLPAIIMQVLKHKAMT